MLLSQLRNLSQSFWDSVILIPMFLFLHSNPFIFNSSPIFFISLDIAVFLDNNDSVSTYTEMVWEDVHALILRAPLKKESSTLKLLHANSVSVFACCVLRHCRAGPYQYVFYNLHFIRSFLSTHCVWSTCIQCIKYLKSFCCHHKSELL